MQAAVEREANSVVNVLLHELETFPGVVIFATNLAANMDPAFERRIRTHILFEMPDVDARERIWRVQLHPRKTPLADDVDFRALAEAYPRSGGDIKNAVLKAAQIATTEPGPDAGKRIHQRHFVQGMEEVIAGTSVMGQSLFDEGSAAPPSAMEEMSEGQEALRAELALVGERLDKLERRQAGALQRIEERQTAAATEAQAALAAEARRARLLWAGRRRGAGARRRGARRGPAGALSRLTRADRLSPLPRPPSPLLQDHVIAPHIRPRPSAPAAATRSPAPSPARIACGSCPPATCRIGSGIRPRRR